MTSFQVCYSSEDVVYPIVVAVHGPVHLVEDSETPAWIAGPIDSLDRAKALVGTVQGRHERGGHEFGGGVIQPYGVEPPRGRLQIEGPLKCRLDYGNTDGSPRIYDELPVGADQARHDRRGMIEDPPVLEHPDTVIIQANEHYPEGIIEASIGAYYYEVSPLILKQYRDWDLDGLVLTKVDDKVIVRRHASLDMMAMEMTEDAYRALNRGRTVEFHFAIKPQTRLVWLDFDPKAEFPWEDTKRIVRAAARAIRTDLDEDVVEVEVRFSGKDGFHVVAVLGHPALTDTMRQALKEFAERFVKEQGDPRLVTGVTKDPKTMRVDYSTFHVKGGLRCAWSLAHPTGLVCLPVAEGDVEKFERNGATIWAVRKQRVTAEKAIGELPYRAGAVSDVLFPGAREAFERWMGTRSGKLTGADVRTILKTFDALHNAAPADDPAKGERDFVRIVQEIGGFKDTDEIFRSFDALRALSVLPKYQASQRDAFWTVQHHSTGEFHKRANKATAINLAKSWAGESKTNVHVFHQGQDVGFATPQGNFRELDAEGKPVFADHREPGPLTMERFIPVTRDLGVEPLHSELERAAPGAIKFIVDLEGKIPPEDLMRHIRFGLGLNVPPEQLKEFVGRLRSMLVTAAKRWTREDPLVEYRKKRDFTKTTEPKGEIDPSKDGAFIIQKYAAGTAGLRWDLRLANEGVLASWVMRDPGFLSGQSQDAEAIHVEDHPTQYLDFSGSIPAGLYGNAGSRGSGQVDIWDRGTYEFTLPPRYGLWAFILHGDRLSGKFRLVQQGGKVWYLRRVDSQEDNT